MLEKVNNNIVVIKESPKCTRCGGSHYDFYCVYHKVK